MANSPSQPTDSFNKAAETGFVEIHLVAPVAVSTKTSFPTLAPEAASERRPAPSDDSKASPMERVWPALRKSAAWDAAIDVRKTKTTKQL